MPRADTSATINFDESILSIYPLMFAVVLDCFGGGGGDDDENGSNEQASSNQLLILQNECERMQTKYAFIKSCFHQYQIAAEERQRKHEHQILRLLQRNMQPIATSRRQHHNRHGGSNRVTPNKPVQPTQTRRKEATAPVGAMAARPQAHGSAGATAATSRRHSIVRISKYLDRQNPQPVEDSDEDDGRCDNSRTTSLKPVTYLPRMPIRSISPEIIESGPSALQIAPWASAFQSTSAPSSSNDGNSTPTKCASRTHSALVYTTPEHLKDAATASAGQQVAIAKASNSKNSASVVTASAHRKIHRGRHVQRVRITDANATLHGVNEDHGSDEETEDEDFERFNHAPDVVILQNGNHLAISPKRPPKPSSQESVNVEDSERTVLFPSLLNSKTAKRSPATSSPKTALASRSASKRTTTSKPGWIDNRNARDFMVCHEVRNHQKSCNGSGSDDGNGNGSDSKNDNGNHNDDDSFASIRHAAVAKQSASPRVRRVLATPSPIPRKGTTRTTTFVNPYLKSTKQTSSPKPSSTQPASHLSPSKSKPKPSAAIAEHKAPTRSERDQKKTQRGKHQSAILPKSGFKYNEVVRNRSERKSMAVHECKDCAKFFEAVMQGEGKHAFRKEEDLRCHCRHRGRFSPSSTPDDFWELSFMDEKHPLSRAKR